MHEAQAVNGSPSAKGAAVAAMDFQRRFMEGWLRFIGFTDIREIIDEGKLNPATVAAAD